MPGTICASDESNERIQSAGLPLLGAGYATRRPSGDTAIANKIAGAGIGTSNRISREVEAGDRKYRNAETSAPEATNAIAIAPMGIHDRRFRVGSETFKSMLLSNATASEASRKRASGSFCRQWVSRSRTCKATAAGIAFKSGSFVTIAASVSVTVSAENNWRPVSISYNTQPNAHISVRLSVGLPRACSGDIYAAVPRITPAVVPLTTVGEFDSVAFERAFSIDFARPKSSSLTFPSGATLILAGFKSR